MGTFSVSSDDDNPTRVLYNNRSRSSLVMTNSGNRAYFKWSDFDSQSQADDRAEADDTSPESVYPTLDPNSYHFYLDDNEMYEIFPDSEHRALFVLWDGDGIVSGGEN